MKTNVLISFNIERDTLEGLFQLFETCSSWGNNDKVMKPFCGLFGGCVQINKSSGGS